MDCCNSSPIGRRPRRLRRTEALRALVRETRLVKTDLVYPLFVIEGKGIRREVPSMPGVYQFSLDKLGPELDKIESAGVGSILLFGLPLHKDPDGKGAYAKDGIIPKAIRAIKKRSPHLIVMADVCLCEYTDHGHCGRVSKTGEVLNDETLPLLSLAALAYANAGADVIAPSDMMDGRIGAIRDALDHEGFLETPIMSYAVKQASSLYGPFRDAACSAPKFGDRRSYQMDAANAREAIIEAELDFAEGADILMVKPAISNLDLIRALRDRFDAPIAAYQVSGEYAMIKAAAKMGSLDEKAVALETLTAMKRAGAGILITYFAKQVAEWL